MVSVLYHINHPLKRLVKVKLVISEETLKKAERYCIENYGMWRDECLEEIILKQIDEEAQTALGVVP